MKKIVVPLILISVLCCFFLNANMLKCQCVYANNYENEMQSTGFPSETQTDIYVVYDEENNYLFERNNIQVGDEIIDKNMNLYRIVAVDKEQKIGKAEYVLTYKLPKLKERKATSVGVANTLNPRGTIGLYMSHNDESYVSGDGYDSVYGKGGIHDITKLFSMCLQSKAVNTVVDETLHLPHDTYAYSRSSATAKRLLTNNKLDALFDIHRDGTSRGFYVVNQNGTEHCMVRMVIGKSNKNYEINKGFALYLMSVANIYCPWLFVDVYMGNGHYNQALNENMVLFEMGSHLVEKDLVLKTVPELAEVVSVALFGEFEVDENDNQTNNGTSGETTSNNTTNGSTANSGTNNNTAGGSSLPNGNSSTINGSTSGGATNNGSIGSNSSQGENYKNEYSNGNLTSGNENNNSSKGEYFEESKIDSELLNNQTQTVHQNQSTFIKGENSLFIVLFIVGLLIIYVLLMASVKHKHKK